MRRQRKHGAVAVGHHPRAERFIDPGSDGPTRATDPADPAYWSGREGFNRIKRAPQFLPFSELEALVIASTGYRSREHRTFRQCRWIVLEVGNGRQKRFDVAGEPRVLPRSNLIANKTKRRDGYDPLKASMGERAIEAQIVRLERRPNRQRRAEL